MVQVVLHNDPFPDIETSDTTFYTFVLEVVYNHQRYAVYRKTGTEEVVNFYLFRITKSNKLCTETCHGCNQSTNKAIFETVKRFTETVDKPMLAFSDTVASELNINQQRLVWITDLVTKKSPGSLSPYETDFMQKYIKTLRTTSP